MTPPVASSDALPVICANVRDDGLGACTQIRRNGNPVLGQKILDPVDHPKQVPNRRPSCSSAIQALSPAEDPCSLTGLAGLTQFKLADALDKSHSLLVRKRRHLHSRTT